jgi:hypothetical protein
MQVHANNYHFWKFTTAPLIYSKRSLKCMSVQLNPVGSIRRMQQTLFTVTLSLIVYISENCCSLRSWTSKEWIISLRSSQKVLTHICLSTSMIIKLGTHAYQRIGSLSTWMTYSENAYAYPTNEFCLRINYNKTSYTYISMVGFSL